MSRIEHYYQRLIEMEQEVGETQIRSQTKIYVMLLKKQNQVIKSGSGLLYERNTYKRKW